MLRARPIDRALHVNGLFRLTRRIIGRPPRGRVRRVEPRAERFDQAYRSLMRIDLSPAVDAPDFPVVQKPLQEKAATRIAERLAENPTEPVPANDSPIVIRTLSIVPSVDDGGYLVESGGTCEVGSGVVCGLPDLDQDTLRALQLGGQFVGRALGDDLAVLQEVDLVQVDHGADPLVGLVLREQVDLVEHLDAGNRRGLDLVQDITGPDVVCWASAMATISAWAIEPRTS